MSFLSRDIFTRDSLIVPPATEALDLDYVRKHIKSITTAEDILLVGWIAAARQYFEEITGRQLITATWETWLDECPTCNGRIELPHPPLQDIVSVQYVDSDGTVLSYSDGASPDLPYYVVKAPVGPYASRGWIEPISGNYWPTTRAESGAVRIQYRAGYGDTAADVPDLIKAILCSLVASFEQFRSEVHQTQRGGSLEKLPFGVEQMILAFKYSALPTAVPRRSWPWL